MAVSKQDVLDFISSNMSEKRKLVPTKDIVAALGADAVAVIKSLKEDGTLLASRGRYGGVKTSGASQTAGEAPAISSDVADQFAELMAKLEADEAAASQDNQQQAVAV